MKTKTRHCQPLRHRNRYPPRETLNHFYCIELSLLPTLRTSKRVLVSSRSRAPLLSFCFIHSALPPFVSALRPLPGTLFKPDNANSKAFTPLWLPKWNKFFNSQIYRPCSRLSPRFLQSRLSTVKDYRALQLLTMIHL